MIRSTGLFLASALCILAISCSNSTAGKGKALPADPFVGFFAAPSAGILELRRAGGEEKYRGKMWVDFGPFPVQLTREGDLLRGTVTYGGKSHPLQVENTPQGLVIIDEEGSALGPLQRYENMKAYAKWQEQQGPNGMLVPLNEGTPRDDGRGSGVPVGR